MKVITLCRQYVRAAMGKIAFFLDRLTKGRLHPDVITIFGALMHIPITFMIAWHWNPVITACLLAFFGLFDALDGALARVQKRANPTGMLLDASTDRMKEVALYSGVGYVCATSAQPWTAVLAVLACGASLCVSYVKAKGETAVATSGKRFSHNTVNRMFAEGLLTFELRMLLLILGLCFGQLVIAVALIAGLATITAFQRLVKISRALHAG